MARRLGQRGSEGPRSLSHSGRGANALGSCHGAAVTLRLAGAHDLGNSGCSTKVLSSRRGAAAKVQLAEALSQSWRRAVTPRSLGNSSHCAKAQGFRRGPTQNGRSAKASLRPILSSCSVLRGVLTLLQNVPPGGVQTTGGGLAGGVVNHRTKAALFSTFTNTLRQCSKEPPKKRSKEPPVGTSFKKLRPLGKCFKKPLGKCSKEPLGESSKELVGTSSKEPCSLGPLPSSLVTY